MKLNFKEKLKNIQEKQQNNYTKKQQIIIVVILFIIGITFFGGISMGKAIHSANIENNTKIARPILEVEKDSEILITKDNKQGEYHFIVKNYNQAEEISQVDLRYYIEILSKDLNNSIEYQLYKGEEEIALNNLKTEEMNLSKNKKEEQAYTLKIKYNENQNSIEDIMQNIQIKVHSEQLKI